jgi:hypothetical protein
MKKWMIGAIIAIGAIAIGVWSAYAVNRVYPAQQKSTSRGTWQMGPLQKDSGNSGPKINGQQQNGKQQNPVSPSGPMFQNPQGRGMMGGPTNSTQTNKGQQRISMDIAVTNAEAYLNNQSTSLKVSEVMEFEDNFYVAVTESSTGRGAMELLVDPFNGRVTPEIGANRMWNLKYGSMRMMQSKKTTDNTLTLEEARTKAQDALTAEGVGRTLNEGGFSFYGYYTFDYSIGGKISGMLSVNGLNGQVLFHTWHGQFIDEKEF